MTDLSCHDIIISGVPLLSLAIAHDAHFIHKIQCMHIELPEKKLHGFVFCFSGGQGIFGQRASNIRQSALPLNFPPKIVGSIFTFSDARHLMFRSATKRPIQPASSVDMPFFVYIDKPTNKSVGMLFLLTLGDGYVKLRRENSNYVFLRSKNYELFVTSPKTIDNVSFLKVFTKRSP